MWRLLLVCLIGCGEAASRDDVLVVRSSDGEAVTRFVAIATISGAAPIALTCAPCDGGRVALDVVPEHLVVKAPGFETTHAEGLSVTLSPLPAPVTTDDYATGAASAEDFAALAVTFPSELGRALVVKFYADLQTQTVYFHDTLTHPLHYDFYRDVLGREGTRREFELATYHGADRVAAAGTLLAYPDHPEALTTLTFFPSDDLEPALALHLHELIAARLPYLDRPDGQSALVYLPAGAMQEAAAGDATAMFERAAVRVVTHAELYDGLEEQRLNTGVAFGTLRVMTPEQLASTVVSFKDVLVLTRLPNELPLVGATITDELQTPLAHVNVAARARGTPNLALLGASADARIAALVGELVRFEVTTSGWSIAETTLAEAEAYWAGRVPEPWTPTADVASDGLPSFGELAFDDSVKVGVKAANLAELSQLLGPQAPQGFAVPFHYYDAFMANAQVSAALCQGAYADCVEEGRAQAVCEGAKQRCVPSASESLYAHVDRLLADEVFRGDSAEREASLDNLRWLIRHVPVDAAFGSALDARVAELLGPTTRVRLRSSTNAEDLPDFSGAGLYDSYGAQASGDDRASEEIRKVWASVWNWRAFEERAFWGIDHRGVRMGVAVHPSYPDEQCNGVLLTTNVADFTVAGFYVNVQKGEVAVTNPADGAIPEVFSIVEAPGGGVQPIRQRFSTLSPDAPLMTDAEIATLYTAASKVQQHFAPLYGVPAYDFALDLEFKLHGPERQLIIKQARPYHDPGDQR